MNICYLPVAFFVVAIREDVQRAAKGSDERHDSQAWLQLPLASKPQWFLRFLPLHIGKLRKIRGFFWLVNAAPFSHFVSLSSEFDITLVEARYRGGLDECSNAEKQVKVVDSKSPEGHWGRSGQVKATKNRFKNEGFVSVYRKVWRNWSHHTSDSLDEKPCFVSLFGGFWHAELFFWLNTQGVVAWKNPESQG